ncbi:MAG: serine protease [Mucilaginibacter sp.]|nr:serine protease [Mucilaginibacter sp.]
MSDDQLLEVIERYLNGEMKPDERKKFELLRKENAEVDGKVVEHKLFISLLKQYGERVELESRLNAIHDEIDVHTLKENLMVHPLWIVQLWRNHHSKISVAASVAIFTVLSVLLFTGKMNNSDNSNIIELKNKVDRLDKSNTNLSRSINAIKSDKSGKSKPVIDKYSETGTGFAITADGLIATNYHVVVGANAVSVQNAQGDSYKAEVLYAEPQHDIAILKIVDKTFEGLDAVPYTFKRAESNIAEEISTYGYPEGYPTYSPGSLSSLVGQNGDSVHYKVTIPINPGNSGGPLWDSKGNIIGITDAKQSQAEGEHFAIKSRYLLNAIKNIPADSLSKKVILNKKNTLAGLSDAQKIEKTKSFVFMVKVYN